jgi:hypothetical protein
VASEMNDKFQEDILPIPEVPTGIKEAVSNDSLAVFIGAGPSRIIGCCGWDELANGLIGSAYSLGLINDSEREKINRNYGPRKKITVSRGILPFNEYKRVLEESLRAKREKVEEYPIYERLYKLRGVYLTTNVDTCFDERFEKSKVFIYPNQFNIQKIRPPSLFHLHGSLEDFNTMIFSTQEYITHYNLDRIRDFLKHVFTRYTVCFLGYSLSELEILDYILLKGNSIRDSPERRRKARHFVLLPFPESKRDLLRFEEAYFSALNVTVVPYMIDDANYLQLYNVVDAWEKEINMTTSFVPRNFQFIEQNIDHYDEENANEIFQLVKNDEHFRNHFFKNVSSVEWFFPLKEKGYFSPEEGFLGASLGNILIYLERVSQQVDDPDNEKYIDELLAIIRDVSEYRDAKNHHIDDYYLWWHFVKILINIPNKKIPLEIFDLIPIWLDSELDTSAQGSEIAGKLLPKFLSEEVTKEDVQKAERIFKYIVAVRGVEPLSESESEISNGRSEPETAVDSFWLIKSLIKQGNASGIGEKCTEKPIFVIADELKRVFRHQDRRWHSVESERRVYHIRILHTNDYQFNFSLRVVEKQTGNEECLNLGVTECEDSSCFEEKIKSEILKSGIVKEVEEELDRGLQHSYEIIFHDYSYTWFGSLSNPSELYMYDLRNLLTLILRDILLAKAKKDKIGIQGIFKEFLGEKYRYPLFKRLILFVIGVCWSNFKEEFWKIIDMSEGEELFDDPNYESELYTLLEKNAKNLTSKEEKRLKEIIEKGPQRFLPEEDTDFYVDYWKQKWYSALKGNPSFATLYHMYKNKTQEEEVISFREPTVKVGPGSSPFTKEEILKMPNGELAKSLLEFKTEDIWHEPSVDGLSDALREAVQEKPEKFVGNLLPFLNTSYYYVYTILGGVKDAWRSRKHFEWGKLFDFFNQYVNRDEFWQDEFKMEDHPIWNADHRWVVSMIGELIQEGARDDSWAFPEDCVQAAERILFSILDSLEREKTEEINDPVTYALNTPFGKITTALIFLWWKVAKSEKKNNNWSKKIENEYERMLKDRIVEAYILFGQYMPLLHAIDKPWAEHKVREFENIEEKLWSAFMSGYLFNKRIYHDLYNLMEKHYLKAISYSFEEKNAEKEVVQHIATSYLFSVEGFSRNSLFGELLEKWNISQAQELISFFWMHRKHLTKSTDENFQNQDLDETEKLRKRIIDFWRWVYEKYENKDSLSEDDKLILSDMAKLAVFLPKINDKNMNWLMLSAPYIQRNNNLLFFIEYLDTLKDRGSKTESGRYVGKIFLKILDGFVLQYKNEQVRSIVKFLFETEDKEVMDMANKICNIYLSHNKEFLRDICEEFSVS